MKKPRYRRAPDRTRIAIRSLCTNAVILAAGIIPYQYRLAQMKPEREVLTDPKSQNEDSGCMESKNEALSCTESEKNSSSETSSHAEAVTETSDDAGSDTEHPAGMDSESIAILEEIRRRTPRYLFRLWHEGTEAPRPPGGRSDLNTIDATTPLAFANGKGHQSVYDMTKRELADMLHCHLRLGKHIETEFSSWSASLNFVLNKCPGIASGGLRYTDMENHDHLYVSVIDVEMLWEVNQVFYTPLLDFLDPGKMNYIHEYLVHGVIKGPWYRTVPYSYLLPIPNLVVCSEPKFYNRVDIKVEKITVEATVAARQFGEKFGERFSMAMTLANLCCKKRERELWIHGVETDDLQTTFDAIKGLPLPERYWEIKPFTGHDLDQDNFHDTWQLVVLMQAVFTYFKGRCDGEAERVQAEANQSNDQVSEQQQYEGKHGNVNENTSDGSNNIESDDAHAGARAGTVPRDESISRSLLKSDLFSSEDSLKMAMRFHERAMEEQNNAIHTQQ